MNKILFIIEILFSFFILSCIPGLSFYIKNSTGEIIEIDYNICDDLLIHAIPDVKKTVQVRLDNEETAEVIFSKPDLFNRGVTKNDYLYTETFLSFFENISIKFMNSDILLNKNDLNQCKIIEYHQKPSINIFTLVIESTRTVPDTVLPD